MLFEKIFLYETKNHNPPLQVKWSVPNPRKCKKKSLRYILRAIVMLFLRAKVIPVNPQIHGNVMCPLFELKFIVEPLFVHAPGIIVFLKFHLGTYTR